MNQDLYEQTVSTCQNFLDRIDAQNKNIIIFLDHDPLWHKDIKQRLKYLYDVKIISDTEEFNSFTHMNGCFKMFIDINMPGENGLDLAEELNLKDYFGDLTFVSVNHPTGTDLRRIDNLGAKFMLKQNVLDQLIHNEGE